jgi:hypothetical protein
MADDFRYKKTYSYLFESGRWIRSEFLLFGRARKIFDIGTLVVFGDGLAPMLHLNDGI